MALEYTYLNLYNEDDLETLVFVGNAYAGEPVLKGGKKDGRKDEEKRPCRFEYLPWLFANASYGARETFHFDSEFFAQVELPGGAEPDAPQRIFGGWRYRVEEDGSLVHPAGSEGQSRDGSRVEIVNASGTDIDINWMGLNARNVGRTLNLKDSACAQFQYSGYMLFLPVKSTVKVNPYTPAELDEKGAVPYKPPNNTLKVEVTFEKRSGDSVQDPTNGSEPGYQYVFSPPSVGLD
ncbi:MAG: hypothetical protein MJA83_06180 [Gammaproteobacteria bacterium]|nr:hypothetical protein [Gammaproteobacteria bacterium]